MTVRLGRWGVLFALLYAVVAIGTSSLSSRPVRPLFDGFAPPVAYNWVNAPPERTMDNTVPRPVEREFALSPEGTDAENVATGDGQAIVGLDKGSVAARPPDSAVKVKVVPLDAATLGPLPAGLRPVSNAYQVAIGYEPSKTEILQLTRKGSISLSAAERGDKLLYSPDGRRWQETAFRPFGTDNGFFADLETAGYFVIASSLVPVPESTAEGLGARDLLLILAAIVPIIGAALVLRLPSPVPSRATHAKRAGRKSPGPSSKTKAGSGGHKAAKRRRK